MENKILQMISNVSIYWINLQRSAERKKRFENQLEKYSLHKHFRIDGIDGIDLNLNDYDIKTDLTKFELGCTLSHLKAIKTAYLNNEEYALIMEDDCTFEYIEYQKYSIKELIDNMNNLYKDWDLLQLVTCNRPQHNITLAKSENYICKKFRNCTTCYLINKKGMEKIINQIKTYSQADYYLYDEINSFYLSKPYFTYNFSSQCISTIHNMSSDSKLTEYKREDENKKFWDNYYLINPHFIPFEI